MYAENLPHGIPSSKSGTENYLEQFDFKNLGFVSSFPKKNKKQPSSHHLVFPILCVARLAGRIFIRKPAATNTFCETDSLLFDYTEGKFSNPSHFY